MSIQPASKSAVADDLQLIRKRELAELLRVEPWTIDNWRKNKTIPEPYVLSPQVVAWRRTEIEKWLAERQAKPAKTRKPNARGGRHASAR